MRDLICDATIGHKANDMSALIRLPLLNHLCMEIHVFLQKNFDSHIFWFLVTILSLIHLTHSLPKLEAQYIIDDVAN